MKRSVLVGMIGLSLSLASIAVADETQQHAAEASKEVELTGEVVDTFCYLSHGDKGLGQGHAECAKKCLGNGLPVALKVGNQLYVAVMDDHTSASPWLAKSAGQSVTVHGTVLERDGQKLVAIKEIKKN